VPLGQSIEIDRSDLIQLSLELAGRNCADEILRAFTELFSWMFSVVSGRGCTKNIVILNSCMTRGNII